MKSALKGVPPRQRQFIETLTDRSQCCVDGVGVVHIIPIRQAATRATFGSLFHHLNAHMRGPTRYSPWPHPIHPLHCRRHQDHPETRPSPPPLCRRFSNIWILPTICGWQNVITWRAYGVHFWNRQLDEVQSAAVQLIRNKINLVLIYSTA